MPHRYVARGEFWAEFDLEAWSREHYDWVQDPWNGFRDFAKVPQRTVEDESGDCEDYALVAIAWAVAQNRSGVGIAFCWERTRPWPTHVIAFDDERVYSSGVIREQSVDEWVEQSRYAFALRRSVR